MNIKTANLDTKQNKKLKSRLINNVYVWTLLIFILLGGMLWVSLHYFFTRNPEQNPAQIVIPVSNETVFKPKWWDLKWELAQNIAILNETYNAIPKGDIVKYKLDHKDLVAQGKSLADGKDIRIIYQTPENKLIPVDAIIQNPNTDNTLVYFPLLEDLGKRTDTKRYFLYIGNSNAVLFTNVTNIDIKKVNIDAATSLSKLLYIPLKAEISRKWYLKGKELPKEQTTLQAHIRVDNTVVDFNTNQIIWAIENTTKKANVAINPDGNNIIDIDISDLAPGNYKLSLGTNEYSQSFDFKVSFPLYVTWTMDWEGLDVKDEYLTQMQRIATQYNIPITHYFNPRIYVSTVATPQRSEYLTNWVKNRRTQYGDEISLHLHMQFDMIKAAGIDPPKTEPNWATRPDGYDVITTAYTPEEYRKLLEWSINIFKEKGLGVPVGYRAGGWFMDLAHLKVLEDVGFKYDSSGRKQFIWGPNKIPGTWNLTSTTRPYRVSQTDQNSGKAPTMKIWEFPNNGSESTNNFAEDMNKRFTDNFNGDVMKQRQVLTFLSHPHWFNLDVPRLDKLYTEVNKHLAKDDNGPVIYTTLEKMYKLYEQNNY